MARDFSEEHSNEWKDMVRRDPERWTMDLWAEVYNFPKEGRGWASRIDKYASGKFSFPVNLRMDMQ